MRSAFIRSATILVFASACAARAPTPSIPLEDRDLLTQAQMVEHNFATVYDAIEALHSNWLQTRGADSFRTPSQVRVYQDVTLLGGVDVLRSVPVAAVMSVRYFNGVAATARWGLGHGQGVILLETVP